MRRMADLSSNKTTNYSHTTAVKYTSLWALVAVALCLLLSTPAVAQEKYLVSTDDGLLSLYDLATNSLIESVKGSLALNGLDSFVNTPGVPIPGPNARLAFDVSGAYVSVIDLTINRETNRMLKDVLYGNDGTKTGAITPDGELLLVTLLGPFTYKSGGPSLYVIDTSSFKVVKKVDLSLAFQDYPGNVVALNNKAYVFPRTPSPTQQVAVVDLANFSVSSIPLPAGNLNYRPSVVMPDGSAVLAFEDEYSDNKSHLLFISTASDTVVNDIPQGKRYSVNSFAISPPGTDSSKVFAYFISQMHTYPIDLRANSPTYGQVLTNSAVTLDAFYSVRTHALAVSTDGSRLIVGGAYLTGPQSPNIDVIDTAKMLNDPQNAVVARVTVNNGDGVAGICTGNFSTIPPNTAPTVTGVSGSISNDMPRQIQLTGSNFEPGALVRIGSMDPLLADVLNSSTLDVTVPANAPAAKALDIIVTNPESNAPLDQQNQSGLFAGDFTILPNAKFQPVNQIATVSLDSSLSIYNIAQETMATMAMPGSSLAPAFNIDGKELYVSGGIDFEADIFPVDLKNNQLATPIQICSSDNCPDSTFVDGSHDPSTGNPVIDYVWWGYDTKIHVTVIDSKLGSPTFHTVIRTFAVGDGVGILNTMAVSPDGKYCYISYDEELGILNMSNGQFTSLSATSLGVLVYQSQIGISPDGKLMALASKRGPRYTIKVFDLSNPLQPKRLTELVPLPISGRGFPYVVNYQIAADKLYATDLAGAVVIFNFNWNKGDFRQRGYYVAPSKNWWGGFRVSPDGAYFYATDYINDQILVFDANKLSYGRDALLTAIRAPYYPYTIDVSPTVPPRQAALRK